MMYMQMTRLGAKPLCFFSHLICAEIPLLSYYSQFKNKKKRHQLWRNKCWIKFWERATKIWDRNQNYKLSKNGEIVPVPYIYMLFFSWKYFFWNYPFCLVSAQGLGFYFSSSLIIGINIYIEFMFTFSISF